ncbi:MAG: DUF4159 domain-containing protein [Deltaproteobacteria bacterium]|nr:DUF4159 domain-containing protein [Deltaproteobacteria bacterium]
MQLPARSPWLVRTALSLTCALVVTALAPSWAQAIGEDGEIDVRVVRYDGGHHRPRETAPRRLAWELRKRTSIDARLEPSEVRLDDPTIFTTPFLYWTGDVAFPSLSEAESIGLRRFVTLGGTVLVDDASAARDPAGFWGSARRELARALPETPIARLPSTHTVFRSFYLIDRPEGRVQGPSHLDAIVIDERAAVILSGHDLGGAWARDVYGHWTYPVEPGGDLQRERAIRLGVNVVLYALCLDYKDDQVHAPFIMRRRSGGRIPDMDE